MKGRYNLLATVLVFAVVFITLSIIANCNKTDDDDQDDKDDEVVCNVKVDNVEGIKSTSESVGCNAHNISLSVTRVNSNPTGTAFTIKGGYSIQGNNTYYLRAKGPKDDEVCFVKLKGSGKYTINAAFESCAGRFDLGIVVYPSRNADPFCSLRVFVDNDCPPASDDNDIYGCEFTDEFTWLYETCSVVLVDENYNTMTLQEAIEDCNSCFGDCANSFIDQNDCADAINCILDFCLDIWGDDDWWDDDDDWWDDDWWDDDVWDDDYGDDDTWYDDDDDDASDD